MINIKLQKRMSDIDENGENGEYIYIAGVDNDSVLVMQNDSVICHPINIDLYRKYSMPMLAENGLASGASIPIFKIPTCVVF